MLATFHSPYSGTVEDAIIGTASGVMGAYFKTFVKKDRTLPATLIVEQGHGIHKGGRVYVHVKEGQEQLDSSISGTAVYVKNIEVDID